MWILWIQTHILGLTQDICPRGLLHDSTTIEFQNLFAHYHTRCSLFISIFIPFKELIILITVNFHKLNDIARVFCFWLPSFSKISNFSYVTVSEVFFVFSKHCIHCMDISYFIHLIYQLLPPWTVFLFGLLLITAVSHARRGWTMHCVSD